MAAMNRLLDRRANADAVKARRDQILVIAQISKLAEPLSCRMSRTDAVG